MAAPVPYRKIGIALQVVAYAANACLWIISIMAIICGFVIGYSNNTIRLEGDLLDIAVTTPATAFIIYGLLLAVVSLWGCFATVSAKLVVTIIYFILIVSYFIFDIVQGFLFLLRGDSILAFYNEVNSSMNNYGDTRVNKSIGIIPVSSTVYWEHLQNRGQCCGIRSFEDWRNTTYSLKEHGIPDSCCGPEYAHRYCGTGVFLHPDREGHIMNELLHPLGCMYIFPEFLQPKISKRITYVGRFACCLLILCALLTIVLIVLVFMRKFRPEEGIDNLDFVDLEKEAKTRRKLLEEGGDKNPNSSREDEDEPPTNFQFIDKLKKQRVDPENLERGDRPRRSSTQPPRQSIDKNVLFRESGPQFIPRFEQSDPDTYEPPQTHRHHRRSSNARRSK